MKRKKERILKFENFEERLNLNGAPYNDPDDQISEASSFGNIRISRFISTAIEVDQDVDLFHFRATKGQEISFDIDTATNGDPGLGSYLRVFDSQGNQLAANNDAAGPGEQFGFDAYIEYTFAERGDYYVGVSHWQNRYYDIMDGSGDSDASIWGTGAYDLILTNLSDPDDQIVEARNLGQLDRTKVRRDKIDNPSDVDTYKFQVREGQEVGFDIDTPTNGDPGLGSYLRLFDSEGKELASNNDAAAGDESTVGFDAYIKYEFMEEGTYYISVSNWQNRGYSIENGDGDTDLTLWGTGRYTLVVSDPDDQISEATDLGKLTRTQVVKDEIAQPKDVDMYAFEVTAYQRVAFDTDLTGAYSPDTRIRIFRANGKQLKTAYNNDAPREINVRSESYLEHTFQNPGTYYVGVSAGPNRNYDPLNGDDSAGGKRRKYRLVVTPVTSDIGKIESGKASARGRLWMPNRLQHRAAISVSLKPLSGSIVAGKRTWIVSHGRGDNPGSFTRLANLVQAQRPADQVLLLNWSQGAADNTAGLDGAEWIPSVAHWIRGTLAQLSVSAKSTFFVGHSWGSYVAYESAKVIPGKVGGIMALDPARAGVGYAYQRVNFGSVAHRSWSFYGRGTFGSSPLSLTANQAYKLEYNQRVLSPFARHSAPVVMMEDLLAGNSRMAKQFRVQYLVGGRQPFAFKANAFDNYEGVFKVGTNAGVVGDAINVKLRRPTGKIFFLT